MKDDFEERMLRLNGERLQWLERSRQVAAKLRSEQGVEVTPDEVSAVRLKLLKHVRERAHADGVSVPADDEALHEWLMEALREDGV